MADKHTIIVLVLAVLVIASLLFGGVMIVKSDKAKREKYQLLAELQKYNATIKNVREQQRLMEEEKVTLEQQKSALEREKSYLEIEKSALKETKSRLEEQLVEEIEARPLFNVEKESPFDHVKDTQVRVLQNKVEIDLKDVSWWTILDTNSMDPLIDIGTTALTIKPPSEESIHVGDVGLYDSLLAKQIIIHRVIKTDADAQGWYSTFKGDNLEEPDPENVRFPKIKGVLIGVIY